MFANQDRNDPSKQYFTIEIKVFQTKPQEAIDQDERRKEKAAKFRNKPENPYQQAKDGSGFSQQEVEQKPTPPVFDDLDF